MHKLDVFNRMQGIVGGVVVVITASHTRTLSPLLGKKGGHRVLLAINPLSRLPTTDLSRQPALVPEHDELWDSGGVTPSPGPPTTPTTLLLIIPLLCFALSSRSSETLPQTTKRQKREKKNSLPVHPLCYVKLPFLLALSLSPTFISISISDGFFFMSQASVVYVCVRNTRLIKHS